jgi:ABC-type phosphate/phosphonate transport system substrate-binding protein
MKQDKQKSSNVVDMETGELLTAQPTKLIMVWNSLNARYRPKNLKYSMIPERTIPDQSMDIKTLVERYVNGVPMQVSKVPYYDEEGISQGINTKTLDLIDIENLRLSNVEKIEALQKKWKDEQREQAKQRREKAEAAAAAATEAAYERMVKKHETTGVKP